MATAGLLVFIGEVHYYGRRIIIVTPFVNQQFSLQVVERGRAVQSGIVEQFTSGEDVTPSLGLLPAAQNFLATIWPLIEILRSLVVVSTSAGKWALLALACTVTPGYRRCIVTYVYIQLAA